MDQHPSKPQEGREEGTTEILPQPDPSPGGDSGKGEAAEEEILENIALDDNAEQANGDTDEDDIRKPLTANSDSSAHLGLAHTHRLPAKPKVMDFVLYFPLSVKMFVERLTQTFGWQFVLFVIMVYGIQQGWAMGWSGIATYWYLLDPKPKGLGLRNTTYSVVLGFANIPWQIKAVYGIISDTFPIFGRHRSPYIALAAACGLLSYVFLALELFETTICVAVLLFLTNLAQASPDVMIDAAVAERSQTHPLFATDLQTLCWSSYFFFNMIAYQAGGYIQQYYGHRILFLSLVFTCLLVLYPALNNWLGDKPASSTAPYFPSPQDRKVVGTAAPVPQKRKQTLMQSFRDPLKGPVFRLALFVTCVSLAQGFAANAVADIHVPIFGCITIVLISGAIWFWLSQISRLLTKATLMIFLFGALQPTTSVVSVWSKETNPPGDQQCGSPDAPIGSDEHQWYQDKWCHSCAAGKEFLEYGYARPCFDAPFLALTAVIGSFFGLVGTGMYNKYFGQWPYRKIWTLTSVLFIVLSFLDLIWVNRWNLRLGISDRAFVIGQELFVPVIMRLAAMPLFVLAAQLCPANVEATLFALIMGISNMSWVTGSYLGVGVVAALDVYEPTFYNIEALIYIRSACSFIPLLLIPILCPKGTPSDTMNTMEIANNKSDERGNGEMDIQMEEF